MTRVGSQRHSKKLTINEFLNAVHVLTYYKSLDTNLSYSSFVNTVWDPKNVRSFLMSIGS